MRTNTVVCKALSITVYFTILLISPRAGQEKTNPLVRLQTDSDGQFCSDQERRSSLSFTSSLHESFAVSLETAEVRDRRVSATDEERGPGHQDDPNHCIARLFSELLRRLVRFETRPQFDAATGTAAPAATRITRPTAVRRKLFWLRRCVGLAHNHSPRRRLIRNGGHEQRLSNGQAGI